MRIKKILCIGAVVILGLVIFGLFTTAFANDSKPAGAIFKRGGLDETTGQYVETKKTIYTKKAISAVGLRIEPDFESTVSYDVYLYDKNDILLDKELGLTKVFENELDLAQYARIVIHPTIPDGVKEKDFKVGIFEVNKYSRMLDITVSMSDSKYDKFENVCDDGEMIIGQKFTSAPQSGATNMNINTLQENAEFKVFKSEVMDEYEFYDVYVYLEKDSEYYAEAALFSKFGECLNDTAYGNVKSTTVEIPTWIKITLEVPEDVEEFILGVSMPETSLCYVYGYND